MSVHGDVVLVATGDHQLALCDAGKAVAAYRVALGRGGTDKRVEGDNKTPMGTYAVGEPRPSKRFGTFIPIVYPTEEQRRNGYTGSDVGIHGPLRGTRWAGRVNVWFDWIAGCAAVASDDELETVAGFVRQRRPTVLF